MTEPTDQELEAKNLRDFWMTEIEREGKAHDKFRKRSEKALKAYEDLRKNQKDESHKFNIFWSNVEVIKSAVYSAVPKPEVRRRFLDKDPVGRDIAELTERCLSYSNDHSEFEDVLDAGVTDYLTAGLGMVRIRYNPYFKQGEPPKIRLQEQQTLDPISGEPKSAYYNGEEEVMEGVGFDDDGPFTMGQPEDELVYQEVVEEQVEWKLFRWQPTKKWSDVRWTAFDHYLTRDELIEQFGQAGRECGLTHHADGQNEEDDEKTRALVHEIFDKKRRKTVVVSEGLKDKPLAVWDDELNLEGFFPHPKPLVATLKNGSFEPIADYLFYQDQVRELNNITERINGLMKMLKVRGIYDGSFKDLANILGTGEGDMTPIDDFTERFQGKGDMSSVMMLIEIDKIAPVVRELYQHREAVKQEIYEITGIADIMRGTSKATETFGAQQIKRQFGSMRISNRQRRVNAFIREIFRLKAEIIAEHFEPDVLQMMTGIEVTPEMQQVMKSDLLRGYRIDVETDSTIAQDEEGQQQARTQMLEVMTTFIEKLAPMVQQGIVPLQIAKELMLFGVRAFPVGRQLEDMLEEIGNDKQQPEDPRIGQMQQQLQQGQQLVQQLQQELAQEKQANQDNQAKAQSDMAKTEYDMRKLEIQSQEIDDAHEEREHKERMREIELAGQLMKTWTAEIQLDAQKTGDQINMEDMINKLSEMIQSNVDAESGRQDVMERLLAQMQQPKQVVRDDQGRVVGVQ